MLDSLTWMRKLPLARERPLVRYGATLVGVSAAFLVRVLLDPILPPGFPYITFFPTITAISIILGVRAGIVAAAAATPVVWYFFLSPKYAFGIDPGNLVVLAFYVIFVMTDLTLVHFLQRSNAELARAKNVSEALASRRELLFRELQHRISNNLQVAASILALHTKSIKAEDARAGLRSASERLMLMGKTSRQIYGFEGMSQPLLHFLDGLARDILEANNRSDIALECSGDFSVRLSADVAVPTAIIIAEAVSNAVEHGLPTGVSGMIRISVLRLEAVDIHVDNSGLPLPVGFNLGASTSIGLLVAQNLARSQGGGFALEPSGGLTRAHLRWPASAVQPEPA